MTSLEAAHKWLEQTFSLARAARARGDHPFGSVIVRGDRAIAVLGNTVTTGRDVTAHAEMNAVRELERAGLTDRSDLVLYASTEPCMMCCGAIYWAGIRAVVFGCSSEALERLARPRPGDALARAARLRRPATRVIGLLLEEQALEVHAGFWR